MLPDDKTTDPLSQFKYNWDLKHSEVPIAERERKKQICYECDRIRYISQFKRPQ